MMFILKRLPITITTLKIAAFWYMIKTSKTVLHLSYYKFLTPLLENYRDSKGKMKWE